ncbi:hypothetical protein OIU76_005659 [Salix suchowensis]|nr:hypothetical protein OIU76_005659 [Salix suchowensis]
MRSIRSTSLNLSGLPLHLYRERTALRSVQLLFHQAREQIGGVLVRKLGVILRILTLGQGLAFLMEMFIDMILLMVQISNASLSCLRQTHWRSCMRSVFSSWR